MGIQFKVEHSSITINTQKQQNNPIIMIRAVAASALVAAAMASNPAPYQPAPAPYHPAPAPYHPAPAAYKPAPYDETPKPYAYEYGVADDYSGSNFNAHENADGKAVTGSYQVHLPDGRIQTVTYTADHYNGYIADVSYEGKAQYPEYKPAPAPYHPAPAYKPAPAPYHPAPAPAYKPAPAPYHA